MPEQLTKEQQNFLDDRFANANQAVNLLNGTDYPNVLSASDALVWWGVGELTIRLHPDVADKAHLKNHALQVVRCAFVHQNRQVVFSHFHSNYYPNDVAGVLAIRVGKAKQNSTTGFYEVHYSTHQELDVTMVGSLKDDIVIGTIRV